MSKPVQSTHPQVAASKSRSFAAGDGMDGTHQLVGSQIDGHIQRKIINPKPQKGKEGSIVILDEYAIPLQLRF